MAKQSEGYMGGFSGRLGPAVGYRWRGVWCMRAHQTEVRNPRTPAQMANRDMFKREVQLAASMRWAVNLGFRDLSYDMHMTPYNLFVHLNQEAFSLQHDPSEAGQPEGTSGVFTVDYSRLRFCSGPLAGVAFGQKQWTADNVLTVAFEKTDDSSLKASGFDSVYLYVYCPDLELGFMASPVYRRTKRVSVALPDSFAGREVQLYGMVCSADGLWSETVYGGAMVCDERTEGDDEAVEQGTQEEQVNHEGGIPVAAGDAEPLQGEVPFDRRE